MARLGLVVCQGFLAAGYTGTMAAASAEMPESPSPQPRPRRRLQFSLRTALLLMVLAGVFFAGIAWRRERAERQRKVVAELRALGAQVDYKYFAFFEPGGRKVVGPSDEFFVASHLRNLLGNDFVSDVRAVQYNRPYVPPRPVPPPADRRRVVELVKQLPRLEDLELDADVSPRDVAEFPFLETIEWMSLHQRPNTWTDADLAPFERCSKLKFFGLINQPCDGSGLVHLHNCKSLQYLILWRTQVNDAALVHLSALTSLQELELSETKVTDAGIAQAELPPRLQRLGLDETAIGDAAMENISQLPHLLTVSVVKTQVTPQGIERYEKSRVSHHPQVP